MANHDLRTFTVIYTQPAYTNDDGLEFWQFFECQAEDTEHAEEQCLNAYPDCAVLWVNLGKNRTMESLID